MKFTIWTFLLSLKFLVFYVLAALGIFLLVKKLTGRAVRAAALAVAFFLLANLVGFVIPSLAEPLGLHPSPMCALVKLVGFAWLKGVFPVPLVASLIAIVLLSLVGKKLFCGWVCPLGAVQELLYLIPGVPRLRNLPFALTNGIRTFLFVAFLAAIPAFGFLTYDEFHLNAFEALHWNWTLPLAIVGIVVFAAALFYYRPYCYLVCPIGLLAWVLERPAALGVRVDRPRCTSCLACVKKSPCPAIGPLVEGKAGWLPDCTSCGLCLPTCPENALYFGFSGSRQGAAPASVEGTSAGPEVR